MSHETDIAPGMLARLREKGERLGLGDQVRVQDCSFTELDQIQEKEPFDSEGLFENRILPESWQLWRHFCRQ